MAILALVVFVVNTTLLLCLWRAHQNDLVRMDEEHEELLNG